MFDATWRKETYELYEIPPREVERCFLEYLPAMKPSFEVERSWAFKIPRIEVDDLKPELLWTQAGQGC